MSDDLRPTADDLARNLIADFVWVTDSNVCITPRMLVVVSTALRRAIAAEDRMTELERQEFVASNAASLLQERDEKIDR